MPSRPLTRCIARVYPPCQTKCAGSYCDDHPRPRRKENYRGSSSARGYDRRWRKARLRHLQNEPLCRICKKTNRITEATVVDHIIPHRGNQALFWDRENWQSLCETCHNRKTATEDRIR